MRSEALAGLAAGKHTASLDLEQANSAAGIFSGVVVSGLPCGGQLDAKDAGGFIFGDLACDAQRLARQGPVLLGKDFCIPQDIHDRCILSCATCLTPDVEIAMPHSVAVFRRQQSPMLA
jgi:hypothetical protein